MPPLDRSDRLSGGLLGLLVGDALGVPYEFHPPGSIPPLDRIEMAPPEGFRPAHRAAPGTDSDDGAQALALLDSLQDRGGLDMADFAARLVDWLELGRYAVDRHVFDVGAQTSTAIRKLQGGTPAGRSGGVGEMDNGNGSLMRALPAALWHRGTDLELIQLAGRQSTPTHAHPRSRACCSIYCLWARRILQGDPDPWRSAWEAFLDLADGPGRSEALAKVGREPLGPVGGSGYVVDCLHSARWAVESSNSFEGSVRKAISLGHDTDTTACVAGGIAGLVHGRGGIPGRWLATLKGEEWWASILAKLVGD